MSQVCRFDAMVGTGVQNWHSYSDCYKVCLATGCPDSKLGNGVCDEGALYLECNSNECGWDWGDCGYCAPGCFKSMIEDRACHEPCNNEICAYDNGACVGQCGYYCEESNLGDNRCHSYCYTKECNFDKNRESTDPKYLGDCRQCLLGFRQDDVCQPICNTTALNFDNGYCLCGRDCLPSMMNDSKCNYECLTPKCGYNEVERCQECAPGCPLKPDRCIPECLNVKCRYVSGDFCSPIHKTYSLFSQLKARNLKQAFDVVKDCLDKHPECTFGFLNNGKCQDECNNDDCLYDMYDCDSLPQTGPCKRSRLSNPNECILCNTIRGVLQSTLYTVCVSTCPFGFTTDLYKGYRMCVFNDASYNVPAELYVSTSGSDATSDGSLSKPFFSISYAMSRIRNDQVTFYLMKGPHQLSRITHPDTMKTLIGETTPLNFFGEINPTKIEIRPLFCSKVNHSQCVPDGEKVVINLTEIITLDIVNTVIVTDIIFVGKYDLTLGKCGSICGEFMYYCANIRYNSSNGKYYDDRNIEVPSSNVPKPEDCEAYHEKYLIDVHPTGNLIIQNSEFRDFRQELKAIIYSQGGNISLQDVKFSNIRVASNESSAVIYGFDGKLEYMTGSVSLLNNGYEYSDYLKFSGFIAMKGMTKVNIEDVEFDKNLVYIGKLLNEDYSKALGVLMYFENSLEILLKNLRFTNNYVQEGMMNFITNQELSYELDEEGKLATFYLNHIHIENLDFRNNGASKTLGIKIEMSLELLNIFMNNIIFDSNFSHGYSFISISQVDSTFKDIWIHGGFNRVSIDNLIRDIYFPSRSFILSSISILNSSSSSSIISLRNLANIEVSDFVLSNSNYTEISQDILNKVMYYLISNNFTYITAPIQTSGIAFTNHAFFYITKSYKLELNQVNFSNNTGATLLKLDYAFISTSMNNIVLANNTNNSQDSIGMNLIIDSNATIFNITCIDNMNYGDSGVGAFKLSSLGLHSITISNSTFIRNSASSAGAIIIDSLYSLRLSNSVFVENTAFSSMGGAVVLRLSGEIENLSFSIDSCRFERNSAHEGAGGSIVIDNRIRSLNSLLLNITASDFISGFSNLEGSSIYITDRIYLNYESSISNSNFLNNTSNNKGTIYLAAFKGKLLILDCLFEYNSNIQGVSIYSINKNEKPDEKSVILLKSSNFKYNTGNSIIYLEGIRGNTELYSEACSFIDNSANVIHMIQSYWEDKNSEFKNNRSGYGGVGALYDNSKARLKNSILDGNVAEYDGGAIYTFYSCEFICQGCAMRNNHAKKNGGVVYSQLKSIFFITDSKIYGNSADKHGSVAFLIDSDDYSKIKSSSIYSNHAGGGGNLFIMKSYLELDDILFYENSSDEETGGVMMTLSTMTAYSCTFSNQEAEDGAFFHMTTASLLNLRNSTITNGKANNMGGAIYCISSQINIEYSTITHNTAASGGSICSFTYSRIYIHHSDINNSSATLSGGVIKSAYSEIEIYESHISYYKSGAIDGENLNKLYIQDSKLEYGSSPYGGSISCTYCYEVSIEGNIFSNDLGEYGGAIYLSNSRLHEQNPSFDITNNTFSHNRAHAGGSLFIKDLNINILNNTFTYNSAGIYIEEPLSDLINGIGGGIYSSCPTLEVCQITLHDNKFANNSAFTNGGAIAMYDVMPLLENNQFFNNSAIYGNDISSYPIRFDLKHYNDSYDNDSDNRGLSPIPILASYSNIASGQVNKQLQLELELIDHFNQVVVTDYSSQIEVIPKHPRNTTLKGKTKVTAIAGVFYMNEFILSSTPGSSTKLLLQVNGIDISKFGRSTALINIQVRECIIGESLLGKDCVVCKSGEYSIDPTEDCKACKSSAVCYGNYTMVPKEGFWRSSIYTDEFFECFNPDACIGSEKPPNQISPTGECAKAYRGNLCNSCEIGYSKASKDLCTECSSKEAEILKLVGLVILVLILSMIIVYVSMASATKPKSLKSIYIKSLLNHFQLVSISSTFKLNWPRLINFYLRSQQNVGIITYQLLSIDCLITSDSYENYNEVIYYTKLIIIVSLPVVIILICLFYWSIVSCYNYDTTYLKRELIASIIILLFFAHPSIVISLFSTFNCMEIEPGEYWLMDSLDIRCWEGSHSYYVLYVSLPGIILWCLGIPAVFLFMLYRNRRFLDDTQIRLKYAYLFNGYRKEYYYWEFLILYRKIILITCAVFLGNSSRDVQALSVMIIMIISLHLQHTRSPYIYPQLNTLELRSIIVVSITIYSGLYFLTDHLWYEAVVALFVLILAANAYFLIYWVKNMVIETKIYELIPFLKNRLSKTVRDTYSKDLFVKKNNRDSTKFSNFVFDSKVIPELLPIIPNEYYENEFNMRKFYLEIASIKNKGLNLSDPSKFRIEETTSTQPYSIQSSLKQKESRKLISELNLPFKNENRSNQVPASKLESLDSASKQAPANKFQNQDSVSTAAFSVQNSLLQIPSIIHQPQEMLDHRIRDNQDFIIQETDRSAEESIEESNPIQEWISKLDRKI